MKPLPLLLILLALAACTPLRWDKPGVTMDMKNQDLMDCDRLAARQAMADSWDYAWPWMGPRYDRFGRPVDPFWGRHYTMMDRMDRERSLRDFCMRSKGYDLVPAE